MNLETLKWFAQNDESLADFETAVYDGNKKIALYHVNQVAIPLLPFYAEKLLSSQKHVEVFLTSTLLSFFIVKDKKSSLALLVGPVLFSKLKQDSLKKISEEINIGFEQIDTLSSTLKALPRTFPNTFWNIAMSSYVTVNQDLNEVTLPDFSGSKVDQILLDSYKESVSTSEMGQMEGAAYSVEFEDKMIAFIQSGSPEKGFEMLPHSYHHRTILLNLDEVRAYKDRCITMIGISIRAAAEAGLDPNSTCILNDMYIQKIENAKTVSEMNMIQYSMLKDLATRVGEAHLKHTENPTIDRAIKYVSEHITEKITTKTAAKDMNVAPNYLSSRFKKETNIRFMSFVTIAKVDEAKKLLKMTNKGLSEISNYLSFSSQSYFQNVFKKSTGMTPLEYRDKNQVKGEEK